MTLRGLAHMEVSGTLTQCLSTSTVAPDQKSQNAELMLTGDRKPDMKSGLRHDHT